MRKKQSYKTINWPEYNKKKVNEGDVRLFFTDDVISAWYAPHAGNKHRPQIYADTAIELALIIRARFCRDLRTTNGYLRAMMKTMGFNVSTPDYSTVCRRMASLSVDFKVKARGREAIDLAIDSTGLKVYGRGEWKTKPSDRFNVKNWKMMHLGMHAKDFQIEDVELTTCKVGDGQVGERMINRMNGKLGKVYGDKAYASKDCFNAIERKGGTAIIDLPSNIKLAPDKRLQANPGLIQRNRTILAEKIHGKTKWKERSGYHQRSKIECQMNRFKRTFGEALASRKHCNQDTEVMIKVLILNIYANLGMPHTVNVT